VYAAESPQDVARVLAYARTHGGMGRHAKFAHLERAVFARSGDAAAVGRLAEAYRKHVYARVLASAFVPGALAFLEHYHAGIDLHLVSGTPHQELLDIVQHRHLSAYFQSITGSPTTKSAAFEDILATHAYPVAQVAAVGDALTEFDAASALGVAFVGVVAPDHANPFPAGVRLIDSLEALPAALVMGTGGDTR
jgi:phosphoglycolate phosphatase-like HAD superfamily hydrolase